MIIGTRTIRLTITFKDKSIIVDQAEGIQVPLCIHQNQVLIEINTPQSLIIRQGQSRTSLLHDTVRQVKLDTLRVGKNTQGRPLIDQSSMQTTLIILTQQALIKSLIIQPSQST